MALHFLPLDMIPLQQHKPQKYRAESTELPNSSLGIVYILVGLVMIFLYPLSKKIVIQNTEELKRRREET